MSKPRKPNCPVEGCTELKVKNSAYCAHHMNEYQKRYCKGVRKRSRFPIQIEHKPLVNNSFMPKDHDSDEGLPITWCDKSRQEWATKYHFDKWKFKLLKQPYN